METVYTLFFPEPRINKKEIMRYMAAHGGDEICSLIDECLAEVRQTLQYKICYAVLPVKAEDEIVTLPCGQIKSRNLAKNLRGCDKAIIFAATIGVGIDRLISKYSRLSPTKALCFQAIGAERVEALCDEFCNKMKTEFGKNGEKIKPRFSPGYGDLPLETQKMIFSTLDCPKRIGVALGETLLMSPSKSVTAFVGITRGQEVTK